MKITWERVAMKMTCSKCEEEFELLPDKPGYANVCPRCSEESPEARENRLAEEDIKRKSYAASVRTNSQHREEERKKRLGIKLVKKSTTK